MYGCREEAHKPTERALHHKTGWDEPVAGPRTPRVGFTRRTDGGKQDPGSGTWRATVRRAKERKQVPT